VPAQDELREGLEPYDMYWSRGLRFLVEILAWVTGPLAAAELTGSGWAAIPAALVLVALPAVFSTPGDKQQVVVATPGPARLLIEIALYGAAVAGAWIVWPAWLGLTTTVIVAAAAVTGLPRARWLLRGAPPA
jgi:hypothetical protein